MKLIHVPSIGPDSWRKLLARPEKQWVTGYSARSLAYCWEAADGFPPEITAALAQVSSFEKIRPLLIFPEWKVSLPGGRAASQNDVWVLAKAGADLVSIAIEGKVDEPFGDPLEVWQGDASPGKVERLGYLAEVLGLSEPIPKTIYYQLLHRAASAVIEAERFNAAQAVMAVHSFSQSNRWFPEYQSFARLYGVEAEIGKTSTVRVGSGMKLHIVWVHGEEKCLNR